MFQDIPNVINLHFIDKCNYKCCYCFVNKKNKILSYEKIKKIVYNIYRYFTKNNLKCRINLVGGEIFLCSYLQEIIDLIYSYNIDLSIVCNGSLLTKEFILKNKNKISTIGISVDASCDEINEKIGRCNKRNKFNKEQIIDICQFIKKQGIKLKINHCVSKINQFEDISPLLEEVQPDRFKIFQMKIVTGVNENCRQYEISIESFNNVCNRYLKYKPIIETANEMKSSYMIIDSVGDFYIDTNLKPIGNMLEKDFEKLLEQSSLDVIAYKKRYRL